MISLVIAESSLELIPRALHNHPSVASHARKIGKAPSEILLDNSWHFAAMKGLKNESKRGRPDLVHFSILEATSIPLYLKDELRLYVHTLDDAVITFGKNVRIPKSYHRFAGLIERLYKDKVIKHDGDVLMGLQRQTFAELVDELDPARVIGLSSSGERRTYQDVASQILEDDCIVIGGFQKDDFSDPVKSRIGSLYSVGEQSLESHIVVARMLYEYEKTIFM